jgi:FMN phosphatase YigB (HAD superfamily)
MTEPAAPPRADIVFLFDVDNTLLDNDRFQADLRDRLAEQHGAEARDRYWAIFEALRAELGYVDYLGALQRLRLERLHEPKLLLMADWLLDYPFADRLYAGALDAVRHVARWGTTTILSDGDAVFQPRKIARSGLAAAFGGHALVYVYKEQELADVERWRPAQAYALIDDKLAILDAVKRRWGDRVTTIFVRQGHYAFDRAALQGLPAADVTIEAIADLARLDLPALRRV